MFADCSDFSSPEACYEAGCEWIVTVTPNGNQVIEVCVDSGWDGWDEDCEELTQDECSTVEGCEWTDWGCLHIDDNDHDGDGPPECLLDCPGIEYIDPSEDAYEACDWIVSMLGSDPGFASCTTDCDDETMMEINEIVEACFECLSNENIDCADLFDDETEEDDCDPDLFCAEVLTCVDGLLYPTACGPENCDEPIDTCEEDDNGDDGDGPPECILDCPGIDELGPNAGPLEICDFLVSVISTDCVEDCDAQTLYELEYIAGVCEECLPTGDCDDIFSDNDCSDLSEDECEASSGCEWEYGDTPSGAGECVEASNDDEGLPECFLDCPGIWELGPDSDPYEICEFFVEASGSFCIEDCDEQTLNDLEFISSICEECLATDSCDDVFGDDESTTGDVNDDGDVNVLDVIQTVNIVLGLVEYDASADINSDGSVDITDVVSIINIILGNDIPREYGVKKSSYELGEGYLRIVADADIAGVQLDVSGSYYIDSSSLSSGWIMKEHDGVIVIANIDGTNRSSDIVIEFSGDLSAEAVNVVGWNESIIEAAPIFELPNKISLGRAYPNPFNPSTEISLSIEQRADITLSVLNISGQVISTLASGSYDSGDYSFRWDASNFSSGIYLVQIASGSYVETQKVILVK